MAALSLSASFSACSTRALISPAQVVQPAPNLLEFLLGFLLHGFCLVQLDSHLFRPAF